MRDCKSSIATKTGSTAAGCGCAGSIGDCEQLQGEQETTSEKVRERTEERKRRWREEQWSESAEREKMRQEKVRRHSQPKTGQPS